MSSKNKYLNTNSNTNRTKMFHVELVHSKKVSNYKPLFNTNKNFFC